MVVVLYKGTLPLFRPWCQQKGKDFERLISLNFMFVEISVTEESSASPSFVFVQFLWILLYPCPHSQETLPPFAIPSASDSSCQLPNYTGQILEIKMAWKINFLIVYQSINNQIHFRLPPLRDKQFFREIPVKSNAVFSDDHCCLLCLRIIEYGT